MHILSESLCCSGLERKGTDRLFTGLNVLSCPLSPSPSIQPSPSERSDQWVLSPVHPQGVPVRLGHDRDGPEPSLRAARPRPTQAGRAPGAHHDPRTQVSPLRRCSGYLAQIKWHLVINVCFVLKGCALCLHTLTTSTTAQPPPSTLSSLRWRVVTLTPAYRHWHRYNTLTHTCSHNYYYRDMVSLSVHLTLIFFFSLW